MTNLDETALTEIRQRAEAATPGPWRWQGNVDTGEPYLASRAPGMGASVLAIGTEDRSTTGRAAADVRSYAADSGLDPEQEVQDWATDRYDQPIKEPRLWFYTDHMAVTARERVMFEVAPTATHREDPRVYRADIVGIHHPDAEHIAGMDPQTTLALLDAYADARREVDRLREEARLREKSLHACRKVDAVVAAVAALAEDESRHMVRWLDGSHLIDVSDLRAVLSDPAAASAAQSTVAQVNALLGISVWDAPSFRADVRIDFDEYGAVLAAELLTAAHDADTAATALEEAADAWHPHRADANLKGTGAVTDTPTTVDMFYQGAVWAEKFLRARAAALRDGGAR